jgi:transketolase
MPSWEIFEEQDISYKNEVLPPEIPKLAIEAGTTMGWRTYVGDKGDIIGLNRFGASAPGRIVYEKMGFNVDNVVKRALELVKK